MKRFVEGIDRQQMTLLPESLEEYVAEDNPVRVVEAFVEELDLRKLGFKGMEPADTGRPAYHPAVLLKLYIYGYLNRVQSTRRLEVEAQRNVEVMWLTGHLKPDFKTIANFRHNNGTAIRKVCRQFVMMCRELGLFSEGLVAIDGSKFKAVNSRDRNFTDGKLKRRIALLEESIQNYLRAMDTADRSEKASAEIKKGHLQEKIAALKQQMKALKSVERELAREPEGQISMTDPDARSMKARGTGVVGYNVQAAVDAGTHMVVAHEVTNVGLDREQLVPMTEQAQEATGIEDLTVIADRGYYKSEQIKECGEMGATPAVPKPLTSNSMAEGRFDKQDFIYIAKDDEYRCPAGKRAINRYTSIEDGREMDTYWSSACPGCTMRAQCTTSDYRRIKRWRHEAVLDAMQDRLDRNPELMRIRRSTAEHPFGTIKAWMGSTHFLMKTLPHVQTEMSLHVLAYNLKRLIRILGVDGAMALVRE
jgi:transposase